jgi:arabinofuranosyltransferase
MDERNSRVERWRLRLVAAYAPLFALLAVFAVWKSFLCDDAYISFRYARNLAEGNGLVWNVGERVEGYTNLLWVLELAAFWKTGLTCEPASLLLSALLTAGSVLLLLMIAAESPLEGRRALVGWIALLFVATNRTFAVWSTSGLETRQFTFLLLLSFLLVVRAARGEGKGLLAGVALVLLALTRPEGVLLGALAIGWLALEAGRRGRPGLRTALSAGGVFGTALLLHFLWRHHYYGDWLPNTFHAKVTRPWPDAGFAYLTAAFLEHALYLFVPLALIAGIWRFVRRGDRWFLLPFAWILAVVAEMVVSGGDHFEFRPFDFAVVFLAFGAAEGIVILGDRVAGSRFGAGIGRSARGIVVAGLVAIVLAYSLALPVAHESLVADIDSRDDAFGLQVEVTEKNFPAPFLLPGFGRIASIYDSALEVIRPHFIGTRWIEHRLFAEMRRSQYAPYLEVPGGIRFPRGAVAHDGCIGIIGYSLPRLPIVDTLGLTDRRVAQFPAVANNVDRVIAHDHAPPPGYLEERGAKMVVGPASGSWKEAWGYGRFAWRLSETLFMPISSEEPEWVAKTFAGCEVRENSRWIGAWDLSAVEAARNRVVLGGRPFRGLRIIESFESGSWDGWEVGGTAFGIAPAAGPVEGQSEVSGEVGVRFADSFGPQKGDRGQGSLLSGEFGAEPDSTLVFLVGGGGSTRVGVELLSGKESLGSWRGSNSERLDLIAVDLAPWSGKKLRIRIFDESEGSWGHVLADHFVLMVPEDGLPDRNE